MWLFTSPKNYSEMSDKISKCVFFILLIILFVMAGANPSFGSFMIGVSFGVEYTFLGLPISMALFYIPLAGGILEHAFKLHDKLQKPLHIRDVFDRRVIVAQFCKHTGIRLDAAGQKKAQKRVMAVFYEYASSTQPKIDPHSITLALGVWCWFWIALDAFALLLVMGVFFLLCFWSPMNLLVFAALLVALALFMLLLLLEARRYAAQEVAEIMTHQNVQQNIKEILQDALSGGGQNCQV